MNKKVLILLPALMMVMASCGGGGGSSTSGTTESSAPVVVEGLQAAYEEAASLASGAESTKQFKFTGVITVTNGNSFYVQEGGYGMYVYSSQSIEGADVGQKVQITSTVKNWYGVIETGTIVDIQFLGAGVLPDAQVITSYAQLSGLKQNVLCKADATMPETLPAWSASSDGLPKVTVGSDQITVKFDKNGYNQSKSATYTLSAGHDVHFTDLISTVYNSASQFLFCSSSKMEIEKVPATSVSLAVSCESTVTVGTKFTYTTKVEPENTTDAVSLEIIEGSDLVTIDEDDKTVYTKGVGSFSFKAKAGSVESDTIKITIAASADPVQSISIDKYPTKVYVGDTLTADDFTTNGTTEGGASVVVQPRYTIKGNKLPYTISELDSSPLTVTATYIDKTTTVNVEVGKAKKVYGLDCSAVEGGNSSYYKTGKVTQENVEWVVNANTTVSNGWRFGGKGITDTDRYIYCSTAFPSDVTNIEFNIGKITITLNSARVEVYDSLEDIEEGNDPAYKEEITLKENTLCRFKKPSGLSWEGKFYRFVFNCTNEGTESNQYVAVKNINFYNNVD